MKDMIVWYAYNYAISANRRPNLFKTAETAKEWCYKDSIRVHGKWVPDNYIIDIEEVR